MKWITVKCLNMHMSIFSKPKTYRITLTSYSYLNTLSTLVLYRPCEILTINQSLRVRETIMEGDWGHNSIMLTGYSNAISCSSMYHYYMLCHFIQWLFVCNGEAVFKNRPGCLFIRTFFTEEFIYPLTYNAWNCMHPPFNKFDMWDHDTRPDFMEISSYPCNWICFYNKRH